jgi:hypothetical protein
VRTFPLAQKSVLKTGLNELKKKLLPTKFCFYFSFKEDIRQIYDDPDFGPVSGLPVSGQISDIYVGTVKPKFKSGNYLHTLLFTCPHL